MTGNRGRFLLPLLLYFTQAGSAFESVSPYWTHPPDTVPGVLLPPVAFSAVCLPSGGTRSVLASLAVVQFLREEELWVRSHVGYVMGISGGVLAAIIDRYGDYNKWYVPPINPADIGLESDGGESDHGSMGTQGHVFTDPVVSANARLEWILNGTPWAEIVSKYALQPFGVPWKQTFHQSEIPPSAAKDGTLYRDHTKFGLADRPFLVAGTTAYRRRVDGSSGLFQRTTAPIPFEFTPLSIGTSVGSTTDNILAGFVSSSMPLPGTSKTSWVCTETATSENENTTAVSSCTVEYRNMVLNQMSIGVLVGNAVAAQYALARVLEDDHNIMRNPEWALEHLFRRWFKATPSGTAWLPPVTHEQHTETARLAPDWSTAREGTRIQFGDAGINDYNGLNMAMRRKLTKVVYTSVSAKDFDFPPGVDFCSGAAMTPEMLRHVPLAPGALFTDRSGLKREYIYPFHADKKLYTNIPVLQEKDLSTVVCAMQEAAKSGRPGVFTTSHMVPGTPELGIPRYGPIEILWVIPIVYPSWWKILNQQTKTALYPMHNEHNHTPPPGWSFLGQMKTTLPHLSNTDPLKSEALVSLVQTSLADSRDVIRNFLLPH